MTTPTIADYLKFANLQMAAEAFLYDEATQSVKTGQKLIDALVAGSGHASRFIESEATKFVDPATGWTVLDQKVNTGAGFSGTLFKNNQTGELVISFRSTEFIDDAARDNEATNKLEIGDFGFAFGQLADMEKWYGELSRAGGPLDGKAFSVTGYSLGGHLATAFNLMHPGAASQVVTFNGAGIGKIGDGSLEDTYAKLPQMLAQFQALRDQAAAVGQLESQFTTTEALTAYRAIKAAIAANGGEPADSMLGWTVVDESEETVGPAARAELELLAGALNAAIAVTKESARAPSLSSGGSTPTSPKNVPLTEIAADSLDYQIAVRLTSEEFNTSALSIPVGAANIWFGKTMGAGSSGITNQYDLVGTETTTTPTGLVANSQVHYGVDAHVFIEDQPLYRGNALTDAVKTSFANAGIKLLVPGYHQNDFGDTHSLVLIVDSLNLQNLLMTLAPASTQGEIETLFKAASAAKAESTTGTQGKAEGDVLENILDGLSRVFFAVDSLTREDKAKNGDDLLTGNTWADEDHRAKFYTWLNAVAGSIASYELAGKVTISLPDAALATAARTDFAAFLTLLTGSPVALKAAVGQEAAVAAALGATWADVGGMNVFAQWQADQSLTPAERASGKANYTDQYLKDRAAFLSYVKDYNLSNLTDGKHIVDSSLPTISRLYRDIDKDVSLIVDRTSNTTPTDLLRPMVIFGKDTDDATGLTGGDDNDHLYGGAGMDRLDGGDGNDYIEGNAGHDILTGGEGRDTLLGGSGIDILEGDAGNDLLQGGADADVLTGGKGNDRLEGGLGDDTYEYVTGDGYDTIKDSDGLGRIKIDGAVLDGGVAPTPGANVWISADGKHSYVVTGDLATGATLLIDGVLTVENYTTGQLGLTLDGAPAVAPPIIDRTIVGDHRPIDADPIQAGVQLSYDDLGNIIFDPDVVEPHSEHLYDSSGNDRIKGLDGNDTIRALQGGNDMIEGGDGSDILDGGAGDDRLYGDSEIDLASAIAQGRNGVATGSKGEWLDGSSGNDIVVAGNDNDGLCGGTGNDILVGGGGDDFLSGDDDFSAEFTIDFGEGSWQITADPEFPYDPTIWNVRNRNTSPLIGGNDILYGGAGNDWLLGLQGSDILYGEDGNDIMAGGDQADILLGGAGDDQMTGDSNRLAYASGVVVAQGDDLLDGGDGNDQMQGEGGNDRLIGGAGDDILWGDARFYTLDGAKHGDDYLDGGAGEDELVGGGGNDTLYGGAGNDQLFGDADDVPVAYQGDDYLDGGDGDDYLRGYAGNDTLIGGAGNDQLLAEGGDDTLDGGDGTDILSGGDGNDLLYGGKDNDDLFGEAGNDLLQGGADDDVLTGGKGNDRLEGGLGNDTYKFTSGDGWDWIADTDGLGRIEYDGITLHGGPAVGNSGMVWQEEAGGKTFTYILTDWTESNETFQRLSIQGPNGGLWVKGWAAGQLGITLPGAVPPEVLPVGTPTSTVAATAWYNQIHTVINASSLGRLELAAVGDYGELAGNGRLNGNEAANALRDGAGDDELYGLGGKDTLIATGGNDRLYGGDGDDALHGGADNDLLDGGLGNDLLAGGTGDDILLGGDGDDLLFGSGSYEASRANWSAVVDQTAVLLNLDGFLGDPYVGNGGADLLRGGAGNDWLFGGESADQLYGDEDNDRLYGQAGADYLAGGDGDDWLVGDTTQSATPPIGNVAVWYNPPEYHGNDILDGGGGKNLLVGGEGQGQGAKGDENGLSRPFGEMLRSAGKKGQKRNVTDFLGIPINQSANDTRWAIAA